MFLVPVNDSSDTNVPRRGAIESHDPFCHLVATIRGYDLTDVKHSHNTPRRRDYI